MRQRSVEPMISTGIRRSVDALLKQYELQPNERDIFVEGALDRAVLKRFLRLSGKSASKVISINAVDLSQLDLLPGERQGNRGRLVALARLLQNGHLEDVPALCIIDRDFDLLVPRKAPLEYSPLRKTDFASIEMYFYDLGLLQRFQDDFLQTSNLNMSRVLEQVESALRSLSLMYASNRRLGWSCKRIQLPRSLSYRGSHGMRLNHKSYMNRYLGTDNRAGCQDEFLQEIAAIEQTLPTDPRTWMRGHDFLELLAYAIRKSSDLHKNLSARELAGALTMALEIGDFMKYPLFRELIDWAD